MSLPTSKRRDCGEERNWYSRGAEQTHGLSPRRAETPVFLLLALEGRLGRKSGLLTDAWCPGAAARPQTRSRHGSDPDAPHGPGSPKFANQGVLGPQSPKGLRQGASCLLQFLGSPRRRAASNPHTTPPGVRDSAQPVMLICLGWSLIFPGVRWCP